MAEERKEVPTGFEEILLFWTLMLKVLKQMDPRKIEFWEFDSVVENALSLDKSKGWDPKKTYEILPILVCYLCRTSMDTNEMMFLHMRLRIQLEQYDKEQLEKKRGLIIETDRKDYVIKWSRKVEEKKDGKAMEKSKIESVDEKKTNCDDKKTLSGGEKNQERKETHGTWKSLHWRGYVFNKVKNDYEFGNKSTKLTRREDWEDLEKKPGMTRTAASLADHYRKHMQNRLYSIEGVDAECLMVIGKAHRVQMTDKVKEALEEKSGMRIQLNSGKKIVHWSHLEDNPPFGFPIFYFFDRQHKETLEEERKVDIQTDEKQYVIGWNKKKAEEKEEESTKDEEDGKGMEKKEASMEEKEKLELLSLEELNENQKVEKKNEKKKKAKG
ncbi:unnamed protein product [Caenorhabditis brenneri]